MARREEYLAPRNRKRMDNSASRRLPEPVADLVMERLGLTGLDDVRVITQAVEQLWAVCLAVDRLQFVALDESVVLIAPEDDTTDV